MNDIQHSPRRRVSPRVAGAVGLLAAGVIFGGIIAGSLTANAAPTASTAAAPPANAHGPGALRAGETGVTGANAAKLKAAALKAVPGATVYRIETDADGAAYEAHMTKADGTEVTVKFDKNFTATGTEDGMGKGGRR